MKKSVFKKIAKEFSLPVAKSIENLESALDKHFIGDRKYSSKDYKMMKKWVQDAVIKSIPKFINNVQDDIVLSVTSEMSRIIKENKKANTKKKKQ